MDTGMKDNVQTPRRDIKHFNSTNQSHYCWQKYNEFVLCAKKTGDEDECKSMKGMAKALCPDDWVSQWDDERAAGKFLGVQEHPAKKGHH